MFFAGEVSGAKAHEDDDAAAEGSGLVGALAVAGNARPPRNVELSWLFSGVLPRWNRPPPSAKVVMLSPRTIAIVSANFFIVLWFYLIITF